MQVALEWGSTVPTFTMLRQQQNLPAILIASKAIQLVSFINRDEPAALGCTAAMSPDLPIPWVSLA